jgi:hypothetical protein
MEARHHLDFSEGLDRRLQILQFLHRIFVDQSRLDWGQEYQKSTCKDSGSMYVGCRNSKKDSSVSVVRCDKLHTV